MLQAIEQLQLLGLLVVIAGLFLIIVGIVLCSETSSGDQQVKRESKGVLFIGPIPIVWGFGRRGWYVAGAIAIILLLLYLLILA
ncbi:MAG: TIGR00304 family membrane protein [Candidatus Thorarchaeota archaeon SMTZ1-83]|nr:MAG: hypothetical protein AM324_06885 [Candidatus Thorarchaeota archaeon SMTZ1-83]